MPRKTTCSTVAVDKVSASGFLRCFVDLRALHANAMAPNLGMLRATSPTAPMNTKPNAPTVVGREGGGSEEPSGVFASPPGGRKRAPVGGGRRAARHAPASSTGALSRKQSAHTEPQHRPLAPASPGRAQSG